MPISSRLQGVVQPHPIALEDEGYKKDEGVSRSHRCDMTNVRGEDLSIALVH